MNQISSCALVLVLVVTAISAGADDAETLTCGGAQVTVSPARVQGGGRVLQDFLVQVARSNDSQTFKFSAQNDFLQLRCETNQDGEALLLVKNFCSGSGCAESNFSIIDLKTYRVLLAANARQKGNHAAAESILGKKLKSFSCGRSQGEYCYGVEFE